MATYERWRMVKYYDEPGGFIYQTSAGQRFLKSNKNGFALQDSAKPVANCGNIDWTDGKNLISWQGMHRYSAPVSGLGAVIYKNNKEFDFSGLVSGFLAGAAFKNSVFIVFWIDAGNELNYSFINQLGEVLATDSLGIIGSFLQIVAVSPDCTKAAFIYSPPYQLGKQLCVVELGVNFSGLSVSVLSEDVQDIDYDGHEPPEILPVIPIDFTDTSTSVSYDVGEGYATYTGKKSGTRKMDKITATLAIDYSLSNVKNEFITETEFNYESSIERASEQSGGSGTPVTETETGTFIEHARINYNNQIESLYDVSNVAVKVSTWDDSGETVISYDVTNIVTPLCKMIAVYAIDLRHDLIVYSERIEDDFTYPDFTIAETFNLKIGSFSYKYKDDFYYSGSHVGSPEYEPIGYEFFNYRVIVVWAYNWVFGFPNPKTAFDAYLPVLTDRHTNKIVNANGTIVKIDKNNTIFTNTITALTGAI